MSSWLILFLTTINLFVLIVFIFITSLRDEALIICQREHLVLKHRWDNLFTIQTIISDNILPTIGVLITSSLIGFNYINLHYLLFDYLIPFVMFVLFVFIQVNYFKTLNNTMNFLIT